MSDSSAKQQIVDKIKSNTSILVTVSNDPSVDELSAALGLTLLLNKMKKHATAVFSGNIPPAITFLDPEKTFENTVDSLRDFIIALDKEKADHLRYKVEGDVVKIFVTPYRTTITSDDLDFSQGDYNVELVLALGVKNQGSLDAALEAHGRILHDATVVTIMSGKDKSELGNIGWRDGSASSLSEMIVTLAESLKGDKTLLDEQIATALLSGIVSATERFSNNRTSARVMTMAAQLMGAGANQQLIASKFEESAETGSASQARASAEAAQVPPEEQPADTLTEEPYGPPTHNDGTTDLSEGESAKLERGESSSSAPAEHQDKSEYSGTLNVPHEKQGTLDEVAEQTARENQTEAAEVAEAHLARHAKEMANDYQSEASTFAEAELADQLPPVVAPAEPDISAADLRSDVAAVSADMNADADNLPLRGAVSSDIWQSNTIEPTLGGTLNATTLAAQEEKRREIERDRNRTILSHSGQYISDEEPAYSAPFNAASQPQPEEVMVNPLEHPPRQPTLTELDQQHRAPANDMQGLPPLPDFSTLPPLPPDMPPDGSVGALPPENLGDILPPADNIQSNGPSDPGQFKIPGQS